MALINEFNAMPNVNRYNGFTRNSADFTRNLVNRYFPGSARPDLLNDFGMTSPKAVTKSFANYGSKHPELEYSVERYKQVAGPIRRSEDNSKGTEVIFRSKKWSIPLLVAGSSFLMYSAAAYYFIGRFNREHWISAYFNSSWFGIHVGTEMTAPPLFRYSAKGTPGGIPAAGKNPCPTKKLFGSRVGEISVRNFGFSAIGEAC